MIEWFLALGVVFASALVAMACLLLISALGTAQAEKANSVFQDDSLAHVFLFDGRNLVDASPAARAYLHLNDDGEMHDPLALDHYWPELIARLDPLFDGLVPALGQLPQAGQVVLLSRPGVEPPFVLRAEALGGMTKISLIDRSEEAARPGYDGATALALNHELQSLRRMLGQAPLPIWRETDAGDVIWANEAYLMMAAINLEPGHEVTWPLPALFQGLGSDPSQPKANAGKARRYQLRIGPKSRWFDVQRRALTGQEIGYALPMDQAAQAEAALNDFRQTLSKVFAHLPIGLAIFDRARVLQTFNPALSYITGVDPSFLASSPSLESLLDTLRVERQIPEPRDYRSWRKRVLDLEQAAAAGHFEESWALPSGATWRVTGRPHPDGALAFLIEDISSDIHRARRHRAELDLSQAVLDTFEDPLVVFGQDGAVALSNQAARKLWPETVEPGASARGLGGAIMQWRDLTAPSLFWNDLADYIGSFGPREPWQGELRFLDGRVVTCKVTPLIANGATLLGFHPPQTPELDHSPAAARFG